MESKKFALLDADGLLLKKYPEYFSERFARENDVPLEAMVPFYKGEFRLCQQGKADLKAELAKCLPKWNWDKGVDEFLNYWFTSDVTPDEAVLVEVQKIRDRGIRCYLTSDNEKYRAQYMLEQLDFRNRLDGHFFSYEVGYQKSQPEYFTEILTRLGANPSEVVFWDDDQTNVDVAKTLGIDSRFYENIVQLKL